MSNKISIFQIDNGEIGMLAPSESRNYRAMSDEVLCNAVRDGDRRAGVFLVFHRNGKVLMALVDRYAEGDCRERLLSELVSEVYCYFERYGWDKALPRDMEKMANYLYRVERNVLVKMRKRDFNERGLCRHVSIENMFEDDDDYESRAAAYLDITDDPFERAEAKDYVERLLAGLSDTRRFVLSKRHAEGFPSAEVAEMLPAFWDSIGISHPVNMPTGAYVDNIVCRATKELRSRLA